MRTDPCNRNVPKNHAGEKLPLRCPSSQSCQIWVMPSPSSRHHHKCAHRIRPTSRRRTTPQHLHVRRSHVPLRRAPYTTFAPASPGESSCKPQPKEAPHRHLPWRPPGLCGRLSDGGAAREEKGGWPNGGGSWSSPVSSGVGDAGDKGRLKSSHASTSSVMCKMPKCKEAH